MNKQMKTTDLLEEIRRGLVSVRCELNGFHEMGTAKQKVEAMVQKIDKLITGDIR